MKHTSKYNISKISIGLCLMLVLLTAPLQARAVVPVIDVGNLTFHVGNWITDLLTTVEQTLATVTDIYMKIKNTILDPAAWVLARTQIFAESNKILTLTQKGRQETGGALFVTNWQTFTNSARDKETNFFLSQLSQDQKINPAFKGTILRSLSNAPNQSVFTQYQSTFARDVRDPITGQSYTQNQFNQNFSNGGWQGWNAIVQQPGNNPYLTYLGLQAEKQRREQAAIQARRDEALSGGGALGTQNCQNQPSTEAFVGPPAPTLNLMCSGSVVNGETTWNLVNADDDSIVVPNLPSESACDDVLNNTKAQTPPPDQVPTKQNCTITRPAQTVISDFNQVLAQPIQILGQVSQISQILDSALSALTGNLRSQGLAGSQGIDLQVNRDVVRTATVNALGDTLSKTVAQGNQALVDLDQIWTIKKKSLDALTADPGGVIWLIKLMQYDTQWGKDHAPNQHVGYLYTGWPAPPPGSEGLRGLCYWHPEVGDHLDADLTDAQTTETRLEQEVGVPPTPGTLQLGGPLAQELATNTQALVDQIKILNAPGASPDQEDEIRTQAASLADKVQQTLLKVGNVDSATAEYKGIVSQVQSERSAFVNQCYSSPVPPP